MNIKKFKSVAVAIYTYKLLKKLAADDDRSVGMQITYLVKKEATRRNIAH
jgi:hypothetical protein|tara:strand:+ start:551 stop:700 length:150 start_codon:yes stop_codon:yes gene_type:complete